MSKYYVVIDLEFVWVNKYMRKKYGSGYETIQIGAVLLNDLYEKVDSFMTYVSPVYGKLDYKISNLTGITQKDLIGAPDICTAFQMFSKWLPDDGELIFVSWSESDPVQLGHELEFNHYSDSKLCDIKEHWVDAQKLFGIFMDEPDRCYGLQDVLCITKLEDIDMKEHDAVSDAYNTAILFRKLSQNTLELNQYYKKAHELEEESGSGCTFGDLFKDILLQSA